MFSKYFLGNWSFISFRETLLCFIVATFFFGRLHKKKASDRKFYKIQNILFMICTIIYFGTFYLKCRLSIIYCLIINQLRCLPSTTWVTTVSSVSEKLLLCFIVATFLLLDRSHKKKASDRKFYEIQNFLFMICNIINLDTFYIKCPLLSYID